MQRRTLVFVALLAVVAVATFAGTDAKALKRPKDLADRVAETCNSTCVKSCNATWNEFNNWFKDMSKSDESKCDVCAVTYYAQDFNVEIGKCPCKTLEQFRKAASDLSIAPDSECAECCLDWALDAITYDADCKDPDEMKPKKKKDDEKEGSYRNACGFTIKGSEEEDPKKEEEKKSKDEEKKSSDKEVTGDGVYDYESLGSQFDTCKCICKGLPPCPAPDDAEEEDSSDKKGGDAKTASSFFDSSSFSGPEEPGSDSASMDDALSAILP
jgi:hypothetical protein